MRQSRPERLARITAETERCGTPLAHKPTTAPSWVRPPSGRASVSGTQTKTVCRLLARSPKHGNQWPQPRKLNRRQDRRKVVVRTTEGVRPGTDRPNDASIVSRPDLHATQTIARDVARRPVTVSTCWVLRHRRITMKPALEIRVNRALSFARAVIVGNSRGKSGTKLHPQVSEEVDQRFSH